MQRSRLPPCAFSLLADRLPISFQRFPHWFPILGCRFHDYFFGLLLDQPCSQRSQLFGVAAKHPPFKLELAFNLDVGHNHGQHLFQAGSGIGGRSPAQLCITIHSTLEALRSRARKASKWNPIENRLFSEISKNWAGKPLKSYETVLRYIRTTQE